MSPERYQRLVDIFNEASDLAPASRPEFLTKACGTDDDLRREVEKMLAADALAGGVLEHPPHDLAAGVLGVAADHGEAEVAPGTMLGPYRIAGALGAGGMGRVYRGLDTRLEREVAIKISPKIFSDRFEREAMAIAALNHPHICTLYDVGPNYLVMELIGGPTLAERIRQGPLAPEQVVDIAAQVADALDAAHRMRIVHRDLKPGNIMLRPDGVVKVLDFGIAKSAIRPARPGEPSTVPGMIIGTARYMSPEQARGEEVDAQSDIFALGVVMYEMAAGKPPFTGKTESDTIAEILKTEPPPLSERAPAVPAELERIVTKALAKDKQARYASAEELRGELKALERSLEAGKAPARPMPRSWTSRRWTSRKMRMALSAGAAGVLVIAATVWFLNGGSTGRAAVQSLAVLPFVNVSKDANIDYLSDGITENIINTLAQLPQLKVIARSSAFRYKGAEADSGEIARTLGVRYIVNGRVVRQGETLAISAELVDSRDKAQLWGGRYDQTTEDLQTVQTDIARKISSALHVQITSAQDRQIAKRGTDNPEAYRLYLASLPLGRNATVPDLEKKIDYCRRAIALDPKFALAYSDLASAYDTLGGLALDPTEGMAKAKAALQKALDLDPALAPAHGTSARIKSHDWDWAGAAAEFRRAIELNPGDALQHGNYGNFLLLTGKVKEALAEIRRAQELDPLRVGFQFAEGTALYQARSYDEAIQLFRKIIQAHPEFWRAHVYLGYTYEAAGRYAESIEALRTADRVNGTPVISNLCFIGYSYALWGKRDEALAILKRLKSAKDVSPGELAALYAALGDREAALNTLEQAYTAHDRQLANLISDPHYDPLRAEPRFRDLVRRVGLSQ